MSQKVDLLDEDKPIAQQKFVCVSFVSPENIIQNKNLYFFDKFVKNWDMLKSFQKFSQFTSFLAFKYNLNTESVTADLMEFCKEESSKLGEESVNDDYKTFLDKHQDSLETEYSKAHDFQTNVRGLKIRGTFPTQEEAEARAKVLREHDPNFDVYVGPVGVWMPWEPDAYRTGNVQYLETQLNDLMANKKKNEEKAKEYFDSRVKESKRKAIEENVKKAREANNKLSQTIDKDDNLINVRTNTLDNVNMSLFSENIIPNNEAVKSDKEA
jgi:chemotaxis protein histidine kinase CheA